MLTGGSDNLGLDNQINKDIKLTFKMYHSNNNSSFNNLRNSNSSHNNNNNNLYSNNHSNSNSKVIKYLIYLLVK